MIKQLDLDFDLNNMYTTTALNFSNLIYSVITQDVASLAYLLFKIEELEKENAELKEELEYYKNRKMSGRQKHNAKWMAIYNNFVVGYESGMTMVEIAKRNNVSERTIYRYKAYYDKMKEAEDNE